jgi:hypothetical protein
MHLLEAITEDDMVAVFLKTEINSVRYSSDILALLRRDGMSRRIIDTPDTRNQEENTYRIRLLGDFRGYKQGRDLFLSFPDVVSWYRAILSCEELARVRYVDYSYWNELSGGSRLPADAATNIHAGKVVFGQSTQGFLNLARNLEQGAKFPEMILTGVSPKSDLVMLEGHVRITTYFLAPHCIPEEMQVIVGFSPEFEMVNG